VAGSAVPVSPQPVAGSQATGVTDAASLLANRRRAARGGANPAPRPQTN